MSKTGTKIALKNNGFVLMVSSIMSGDSPTSELRETPFSYSTPGRSTPPATTSYLPTPAPKIEKDEVELEKLDKIDKEVDYDRQDINLKDSKDENKDTSKTNDVKNDESKKLNDSPDKHVSNFRPLPEATVETENDCIVNCLYYTLQCCECTIT